MVIRKLYKIESAHVVRDCTTKRCSQNYHGHSGKIEVFLRSHGLDDGGMVMDFGRLKPVVGQFIDMFDHAIHLYSKDKKECIQFFTKNNERYIILPFNPTAENYALFFKKAINELLDNVQPINGERGVTCCGVRYHETDTGYAESEEEDDFAYGLEHMVVSRGCMEDIGQDLYNIYVDGYNMWLVDKK